TKWQPYEAFRKFHWSHPLNAQLSWNGLPTGLNQFALVVTQVGDPLPPSGGVPFQLKVAEIANRKLNQVAQLFKKLF
ncbi:MAG: hypothetical protein K2X66_18690, partial [Cyanobacteria bacterium]|nr:hypothetical protein [Cyanobacteriota bacterium]